MQRHVRNNNEATAALTLIALREFKGCVVTADALHCHREMAKRIVKRGGDYVLAAKDNQPAVLRDAKKATALLDRHAKSAATKDARHGHKETDSALVALAKDMAKTHDFPGLRAVTWIKIRRGGEKSIERYFLLPQPYISGEVLRIVREHWRIESCLRWFLDVVLDEDLARNRKDNAPANLAVLRRLALDVAGCYPDTKTPLRRKLKRAGWNEAFLFDFIRYMQ